MAFTNYDQLLKSIQDTTIRMAQEVDLERPTITVDWSSRQLKLPADYQSFLCVQGDHQASTIWFCTERYFDGVDLADMTCVVEYINAGGESRIYPVLDLDTTTDPEKIYVGWKVATGATKYAGTINFVLRFYAVDSAKGVYVYNLGTQPCSATILKGMVVEEMEDNDLKVDEAKALLDRVAQLENKAVRWHNLTLE